MRIVPIQLEVLVAAVLQDTKVMELAVTTSTSVSIMIIIIISATLIRLHAKTTPDHMIAHAEVKHIPTIQYHKIIR